MPLTIYAYRSVMTNDKHFILISYLLLSCKLVAPLYLVVGYYIIDRFMYRIQHVRMYLN